MPSDACPVRARSGRVTRAAAALALAAAVGAFGVACPPQDLRIEITAAGVGNFIIACLGCWNGACPNLDKLQCPGDDGPPIRPAHARLFLASKEDFRVQAEGACFDFPSEQRCPTTLTIDSAQETLDDCADALNAKLDEALPDGITFDDLEETDDAILFLGFFAGEGASKCRASSLVSCAGLAQPVGNDDYDITCGSCKNGLRIPVGRDTGPCPLNGTGCVFAACADAVDAWE